MSVQRWKFDDVYKRGPQPYSWTVDVNPNEGGSPSAVKNMLVSSNLGPNRGIILQEGQMGVPTASFSGVILTQAHYEAFELWFVRRVLLRVTDDLGREFRGIFSSYVPSRSRKAFNPWYHTYTAELQLTYYANASGQRVYGRQA